MIQESRLSNVWCDYCSKKVNLVGGGYCYNEPLCDFAVCINCYDRLPQEDLLRSYEKQEGKTSYKRLAQSHS